MKLNLVLLFFLLLFSGNLIAQFNQMPVNQFDIFKQQIENNIKNLEQQIILNESRDKLREQQIGYLNQQLKILQNKIEILEQQTTTQINNKQPIQQPTNNVIQTNPSNTPTQQKSAVRFRRK